MNYFIKKTILSVAKYSGIFSISRVVTRKKLRILCYHGFSLSDQSTFRPKLYIEKDTFQERIGHLIQKNFNFIENRDFSEYLNGQLTKYLPVLITIDDGWKSTLDLALPVLKKHNIPHIIYFYTDCSQRAIPVVNVLLQYAFWKTPLETISYDDNIYKLKESTESDLLLKQFLSLTCGLNGDQLNGKLIDIFRILEVDYSKTREWENFRLLNQEEMEDHLQYGGSFQLHTHHHINPLQDDLLAEELRKNREIVESITSLPAEHFCYPSGVYSKDQFPLLKEMGIKSAVTCKPGLNDHKTHPYELNRFLDGENISQIEFEAEMSGFLDICRCLFKRGE